MLLILVVKLELFRNLLPESEFVFHLIKLEDSLVTIWAVRNTYVYFRVRSLSVNLNIDLNIFDDRVFSSVHLFHLCVK